MHACMHPKVHLWAHQRMHPCLCPHTHPCISPHMHASVRAFSKGASSCTTWITSTGVSGFLIVPRGEGITDCTKSSPHRVGPGTCTERPEILLQTSAKTKRICSEAHQRVARCIGLLKHGANCCILTFDTVVMHLFPHASTINGPCSLVTPTSAYLTVL